MTKICECGLTEKQHSERQVFVGNAPCKKFKEKITTIMGGGCPEYYKKPTEFNLSEKKIWINPYNYFKYKDIKTFIKKLKEAQLNRMCSPVNHPNEMLEIIDKLAGEELSK